jgi:hypothetical protein
VIFLLSRSVLRQGEGSVGWDFLCDATKNRLQQKVSGSPSNHVEDLIRLHFITIRQPATRANDPPSSHIEDRARLHFVRRDNFNDPETYFRDTPSPRPSFGGTAKETENYQILSVVLTDCRLVWFSRVCTLKYLGWFAKIELQLIMMLKAHPVNSREGRDSFF